MKPTKLLAGLLVALCVSSTPASADIWDWSLTAGSNGNSDAAINWQEGQAPSTINNSARAMMSIIAGWRNDISGPLITSGGTANALTLTTSGDSASSLTNGEVVCFLAANTNTGAATVNVDGFGAEAIQGISGSALVGGEIVANNLYCIAYSSSATAWLIKGYTPAGGGLAYTSSGGLQRAALTGDVTAAAGSNTTAIAANAVTTTDIANGAVTSAKLAGGAITGTVPVGMIFDFPGPTCPSESYQPYGQAVSRSTYSAVFALIGTTYGSGDGSSTFNLPDLRGKVVAGQDNMGGVAAGLLSNTATNGIVGTTLGAVGGEQSHTMIVAELAPHSHTQQGTFTTDSQGAHTHSATSTVNDPGHSHSVTAAVQSSTAQSGSAGNGATNGSRTTSSNTTGITVSTSIASAGAHTHNVTISGQTANNGSGQPFNNVQPTMIMTKCLYAGV